MPFVEFGFDDSIERLPCADGVGVLTPAPRDEADFCVCVFHVDGEVGLTRAECLWIAREREVAEEDGGCWVVAAERAQVEQLSDGIWGEFVEGCFTIDTECGQEHVRRDGLVGHLGEAECEFVEV